MNIIVKLRNSLYVMERHDQMTKCINQNAPKMVQLETESFG